MFPDPPGCFPGRVTVSDALTGYNIEPAGVVPGPTHPGHPCHSGGVPAPRAADALLGMLFPFWQLVIGGCVLAVLALSVQRLRARRSSRMVRALTLTGVAIMSLALLGLLLDSCGR